MGGKHRFLEPKSISEKLEYKSLEKINIYIDFYDIALFNWTSIHIR